MIILGIESSCDETAVAIVKNGQQILSSQILSQIEAHREYGGVVPELASRSHLEAIHPLLTAALQEAELTYDAIDAIAVTHGPGLQGALLVGLATAETLAWFLDKPLIGVNHLEGHIYANFLSFPNEIEFPLLVLLVSGGHTQILLMTGHGKYQTLSSTRDDAAGEAFDKVARLLGLPYPGGPAIDKLSKEGNPKAFQFPRSMRNSDDFSFSGLKTAVLYTVRKLEEEGKELPVADLAASFQAAAIETLVEKALRMAQKHQVKALSVTGGVSANSYLRELLDKKSQLPLFMPPLSLCTDNAAMIAACAYYTQTKNDRGSLELKPRFPIPTYCQ